MKQSAVLGLAASLVTLDSYPRVFANVNSERLVLDKIRFDYRPTASC